MNARTGKQDPQHQRWIAHALPLAQEIGFGQGRSLGSQHREPVNRGDNEWTILGKTLGKARFPMEKPWTRHGTKTGRERII